MKHPSNPQPRIGLLPLYLALYDERLPAMRGVLEAFLGQVAEGFRQRGLAVSSAPVCRVAGEFAAAVGAFEKEDVDLVVAVHLAYSPSLESADVLAGSRLPLLFLDTTLDYDFGLDVDPERILYNHGIHGVMDLASVLRRRGKAFQIVAGHYAESDVLDRAAVIARAALGAKRLRGMRVLRVGRAFEGMGDFAIPEAILASVFGIETDTVTAADLAPAVTALAESEVRDEIARVREVYDCQAPAEVIERSVRVGLGLRRQLETGGYGAFSANFQAFDSAEGPVNTVPFLEVCNAMARGIGYAGEGDVLTAAFVGALAQAFGQTTFTEIFCPDWKGDSLFLSHMGEINPALAASKPLLYEKPFPFTDALNPAAVACAPRPGPAVYANLAPGPGDIFTVIAAPVDVLDDARHPGMREWVRAWIRPACPLGDFLERYSRLGGTHHSALVLGQTPDAIAAFAACAGLPCVVIE